MAYIVRSYIASERRTYTTILCCVFWWNITIEHRAFFVLETYRHWDRELDSEWTIQINCGGRMLQKQFNFVSGDNYDKNENLDTHLQSFTRQKHVKYKISMHIDCVVIRCIRIRCLATKSINHRYFKSTHRIISKKKSGKENATYK